EQTLFGGDAEGAPGGVLAPDEGEDRPSLPGTRFREAADDEGGERDDGPGQQRDPGGCGGPPPLPKRSIPIHQTSCCWRVRTGKCRRRTGIDLGSGEPARLVFVHPNSVCQRESEPPQPQPFSPEAGARKENTAAASPCQSCPASLQSICITKYFLWESLRWSSAGGWDGGRRGWRPRAWCSSCWAPGPAVPPFAPSGRRDPE